MSKVFIEDENKNILANASEEPFIIDQVGTDVFVNGQRQDRLDFTSDPQEQLDANQSDLTTLASKVETNATNIGKKISGNSGFEYTDYSIKNKMFIAFIHSVYSEFVYKEDGVEKFKITGQAIVIGYQATHHGLFWSMKLNETPKIDSFGEQRERTQTISTNNFYGRIIIFDL